MEITFSEPEAKDGKEVCELVKNCPPLDVNSEYLYVLLCEHFSKTCVIAKSNSKIIGFISAYIEPDQNNTIFVWQVAVAKDFRGKGISSKMIQSILARKYCESVKYLEATVTPSNESSRKMFEAAASHFNCNITTNPFFTKDHFSQGHEPEDLIRIGPF